MAYNGPLPQAIKAGGTAKSTSGLANTVLYSNSTTIANTSDKYPTSVSANSLLWNNNSAVITEATTKTNALWSFSGSIAASDQSPQFNSITFGSGSALSAYYNKQTWTPSITGATTTGTASYSVREGYYSRIGDLILVTCQISWSAATGTGRMRISGLPFAANSVIQYKNDAEYGAITLTTNFTVLSFQTGLSSTYAEAQISGSGQNSSGYTVQASGFIGWTCWYSV